MFKDIEPISPSPRGGYKIVSMNRPDEFDKDGKLKFPNAGPYCILCQSFDHIVLDETGKPPTHDKHQYPAHCTRCGATTAFYPADPNSFSAPFKPNYLKPLSSDTRIVNMAGCKPFDSDKSKLFFDTLTKFNAHRNEGNVKPRARPLSCDDYKGNMTVIWDRRPNTEQQQLAASIWGDLCENMIRHMVLSEVRYDPTVERIGDEGFCRYAHEGYATRSSD